MTREQKWRTWFTAYMQNYKGSGLFSPEIVAQQAWQAAETETGKDLKRAIMALAEIRDKTIIWQKIKSAQTLRECHRIAQAFFNGLEK